MNTAVSPSNLSVPSWSRPSFRSILDGAVVRRAALVALVLGSVLAVSNQWPALIGREPVRYLPLVLVYLTPLAVVIIMMGVLLFLGAFMDQVSMLLLTLPFFLLGSQSLQASFNIDVVWLMVLMLITMEISLLTPPFGLLLYVMKGVADETVTLGQVVTSALPFVAIELLVLALLIVFPELATWLPKLIE